MATKTKAAKKGKKIDPKPFIEALRKPVTADEYDGYFLIPAVLFDQLRHRVLADVSYALDPSTEGEFLLNQKQFDLSDACMILDAKPVSHDRARELGLIEPRKGGKS